MKKIAKYTLQQKAKNQKRKVVAMNLDKAKTVLIVYNASSDVVEKKVRAYARFLKEEGIKTDTIGFYKSKGKEDLKPEDELGYLYYDKKGLNWQGLPKENKLLKCIAREYHLLIDLNLENEFSLSAISTLSSANFKVGRTGGYQDKVCDLTIAIENNNLDYLLEQMNIYLRMINK